MKTLREEKDEETKENVKVGRGGGYPVQYINMSINRNFPEWTDLGKSRDELKVDYKKYEEKNLNRFCLL